MSQEGGTNRPTLVRPAPEDPDKAPIENVLDVLELGVFGPVSPSPPNPLFSKTCTLTTPSRTSSPTSARYGIRQAPGGSMGAQ
jgi:hypothetical protein